MTWYSNRIAPDEVIPPGPLPATDDAVVTGAMNWLSTRGACSAP